MVFLCLDSGCLDYDRLWITTSLRGNMLATLKVRTTHGLKHDRVRGTHCQTKIMKNYYMAKLTHRQHRQQHQRTESYTPAQQLSLSRYCDKLGSIIVSSSVAKQTSSLLKEQPTISTNTPIPFSTLTVTSNLYLDLPTR